METQGATIQIIPLKGATAQATPLQGAVVQTTLPKEVAEAKLQALRLEAERTTTEERKFKLQDLQLKALTMVLIGEMIAEEEVYQIGRKPMIREEEEIVFNQNIAASAAIFV